MQASSSSAGRQRILGSKPVKDESNVVYISAEYLPDIEKSIQHIVPCHTIGG